MHSDRDEDLSSRAVPAVGSAWTLEHLALVAADLGAWTWEIANDAVHWSRRAYELFSVSSDAFGGTLGDFLRHVHPDDRATVKARIERALDHGPDEWTVEHRVAGALPERWVRGRGRIVRDATGKPLRMTGIVELLGANPSSAEREQRNQVALMQAALDASLYAVVMLEPTGDIVYCNNLAAQLLGLTPSAVRSRTYDAPQWKHTDVDGGPWPDEKQPFARVMASGAPVYGIEHRIERPDGVSKILRINGAPVKNQQGEIKLLVFSFEDVTERKAIEEGFRRAQKMEAIGRLAAGVAHDFNNLLTVILSCASLAQTAADKRELLEYLTSIIDASDRAAALTGQLLMFTRRDQSAAATFDAREEVSASARLIERVVGERISLAVEDDPEPCWVHMDRGHLHQVLVNLAVNARDAMPSGGKLTIAIRAHRESMTVRISVRDTGTGMDAFTQQHAFEPFFTTKPAHKGTGLGLSTCHGIITNAGGCIAIDSMPGIGTTITIDLPLSTEQPRPLNLAQRDPAEGRLGLRVLVVEDEPAVRLLATQTLRAAACEVAAVANAEQALELLEARSFDLLMSDVMLPGMSGVELARLVRQRLPGVSVLLVSGYAGEGVDHELLLAKPYTPETLCAAVQHAVASNERLRARR